MRSSRPNTGVRNSAFVPTLMLESEIVRRRELEARKTQTWKEHTNYFQDCSVKNERYSAWSSARSLATSLESARQGKDKERHAEFIEMRRERLVKLYKAEEEAYEKELKELEKRKEEDRFRSLQHHVISYRTKEIQELEREAEQLRHEQWRRNTPAVREMKSRQLQEQVKSSWSEQLDEKKALKQQEKAEKAEWGRKLEYDARKYEEEQKERDVLSRQKAKLVQYELAQQMEQFKLRERETDKAVTEYRNLLQNHQTLEQLSKEQDGEAKERRKKDYGVYLTKQHLAKLRHRSRLAQEELEWDRKMLQKLQECEQVEQQRQHEDLAEKKKKNAQWMLDWIEKQEHVEKAREKDTDFMFHEEAQKIWEKQEEVWKKEREAREALMREVTENQRQQIAEKLFSVEQEREKLIEERECLLKHMENQQKEMLEEKGAALKRKEDLKLALEDQMVRHQEESELRHQEEENFLKERQLREQEEERRLAYEMQCMGMHRFY